MTQITKDLPSYIKLNQQIRPQDDFYSYTCHLWCQDNPLPKTKSRWTQFNKLSDQVDRQIQHIIKTWLKDPKNLNYEQQQVVLLYESLINNQTYEANSLQTLSQLANKVTDVANTNNAKVNLLALSEILGLSTLFSSGVSEDSKNNQRYCLTISPPSLALPNRDYYLDSSKKMEKIRLAYVDFLQTHQEALHKLGFKYDLKPARILEIETQLAQWKLPQHKAHDLELTYNLYDVEQLNLSFNFDWSTYFELLKLKSIDDVIIPQPDYLDKVVKYLDQLSIYDLKQLLLHGLGLKYGQFINDKLNKIHFDFFRKTLQGHQRQESKPKRTIDVVNHLMSDVIGQTYVKFHFQESHRQSTRQLAKDIAEAFDRRLTDNHWMSKTSRLYAKAKLKNIIVNLGYSDTWLSYKSLKLTDTNPVANIHALDNMMTKVGFNLLIKAPNRRRFGNIDESIQSINAWTNLTQLNTNYPAGILQPPFWDYAASWTYNLGALGSVIGHELTHNFDMNGSKYDLDGHLNPWLTEEEKKIFNKQAKKFIKLANKHYVTPRVKMKGKQIINEAIADLGGLEIVLDVVKHKISDPQARKKALREVFIAYAAHWAMNQTIEDKVMLVKTAAHPDNVFRVNGIVPHCDDFYDAFNVQSKDNLYLAPEDRVRIW